MSWDKDGEKEVMCPCGYGRIYVEFYSDDWNRHETRGPYIDCEKCKEVFHVETVHPAMQKSKREWVYYYLVKMI